MADMGLSGDDRPAAGTRTVDIIVSLVILALALLAAWDSFRVGNSWASDGPEAGYFPFYLSLMMGAAALYGLVRAIVLRAHTGEVFITRDQLYRVLQVFIPTLIFCIATQYLGLYVASFILVAGFMWWIGKISWWNSLLTSFLFAIAMFLTFEIAFNVIMPKGPLEAAFGY